MAGIKAWWATHRDCTLNCVIGNHRHCGRSWWSRSYPFSGLCTCRCHHSPPG